MIKQLILFYLLAGAGLVGVVRVVSTGGGLRPQRYLFPAILLIISMIVLTTQVTTLYDLFFYIFSLAGITAAFLLVKGRNPVHNVMWLITTFISTAGIFLLLGAEFLAAIQVIIYVGAIVVLYVFIIMLTDLPEAEGERFSFGFVGLCIFVGILFVYSMAKIIGGDELEMAGPVPPPAPEAAERLSVEALGKLLFTDYLITFEIASVILLAALFGAVYASQKRR